MKSPLKKIQEMKLSGRCTWRFWVPTRLEAVSMLISRVAPMKHSLKFEVNIAMCLKIMR